MPFLCQLIEIGGFFSTLLIEITMTHSQTLNQSYTPGTNNLTVIYCPLYLSSHSTHILVRILSIFRKDTGLCNIFFLDLDEMLAL